MTDRRYRHRTVCSVRLQDRGGPLYSQVTTALSCWRSDLHSRSESPCKIIAPAACSRASVSVANFCQCDETSERHGYRVNIIVTFDNWLNSCDNPRSNNETGRSSEFKGSDFGVVTSSLDCRSSPAPSDDFEVPSASDWKYRQFASFLVPNLQSLDARLQPTRHQEDPDYVL